MLEMSQRNNIGLEKINEAGHNFSQKYFGGNINDEFRNKSLEYRESLPKNRISGANNYDWNYDNQTPMGGR